MTYEGTHSATRPVLSPDGQMCWNPGDACAVHRADDVGEAGGAALDALADALHGTGAGRRALRVTAGRGVAFVVDNARVLHGRRGQVNGRRRVVGGEAPTAAVSERWAEVAAV